MARIFMEEAIKRNIRASEWVAENAGDLIYVFRGMKPEQRNLYKSFYVTQLRMFDPARLQAYKLTALEEVEDHWSYIPAIRKKMLETIETGITIRRQYYHTYEQILFRWMQGFDNFLKKNEPNVAIDFHKSIYEQQSLYWLIQTLYKYFPDQIPSNIDNINMYIQLTIGDVKE